ncbi:hypothetical protein BOX15_Mlig002548g1 [Macrostomum lignano]|uniref:Major facilitator superfamily (MFS) profile domain-containing protein n=1 Tax=Macrostomum lignano TaxID=282301 RepID=A0A267FAP0_9PLAT|nr:hypothetical protein BOX15_Mlig002548g1 [Macrostomum lignano]
MSSVLKTFECQSFQFSTTGALQETAVSRFGLVCQRAWMSNLATTFFFIGFLFGCSLYGALADRFGRLRMMLIALCNMSVGAIAASQAPFLWLYWCFQLLIGIGIGGFMSCTFSYALENTDPAHRSISGFNLHNGWTVGIFLGTFIAYFERRYSRLLLYKGLCAAAALPPLLILSESPRWLVSARRSNRPTQCSTESQGSTVDPWVATLSLARLLVDALRSGLLRQAYWTCSGGRACGE